MAEPLNELALALLTGQVRDLADPLAGALPLIGGGTLAAALAGGDKDRR